MCVSHAILELWQVVAVIAVSWPASEADLHHQYGLVNTHLHVAHPCKNTMPAVLAKPYAP